MNQEKQTFIALDDSDWNGPWMNRQQLMSRIGEQHKVIYSKGPAFSWDLKKDFKHAPFITHKEKQNNIDLLRPGLLFTRIPKISFFDNWAIKRFAEQLNHLWGEGRRVLYIFHPSYVRYVKHIKYDILVYHCYDNYAKMKGSDSDIVELEESICAIADYIFTSSELSAQRLAKLHQREDVKFIPNGVDIDLFKPTQIKKVNQEHFNIGYIGSMNEKFDFELVLNLATELSNIKFTLIGRANNLSERDKILFGEIKKLPNTYVPGPCNKENVPRMLSDLDINGFFYKSGSFADDCYPLKLHEAFSIGKPIVSTPIHSLKAYEDDVYFARDKDEWIKQVNLALKENDLTKQQRRIDIAKNNTWEIRVKNILDTLR